MEYIKTEIEGVFIIEPKVFLDTRGYFMEAWKQAEFNYQKGETSQAKLVRVIKGKVLDVAVDIRKSSPTFGKYVMVELSEDNKRQFFIPRGFAHGFLVLSEEAIFTYKVDNPYSPSTEAGIRWNDPDLGLEWPIDPTKVQTSEKDLKQPFLKDAEVFD